MEEEALLPPLDKGWAGAVPELVEGWGKDRRSNSSVYLLSLLAYGFYYSF